MVRNIIVVTIFLFLYFLFWSYSLLLHRKCFVFQLDSVPLGSTVVKGLIKLTRKVVIFRIRIHREIVKSGTYYQKKSFCMIHPFVDSRLEDRSLGEWKGIIQFLRRWRESTSDKTTRPLLIFFRAFPLTNDIINSSQAPVPYVWQSRIIYVLWMSKRFLHSPHHRTQRNAQSTDGCAYFRLRSAARSGHWMHNKA